jgi:hypothetical protein
MDPRVSIAAEDLQAQTDVSMAVYRGYLKAQQLRDAIDVVLKRSDLAAERRTALEALRGNGRPGDADVMYGSIYAAPAERETLVGLQEKFLHLLALLQAADARPTIQSREALAALQKTLGALEARWATLR